MRAGSYLAGLGYGLLAYVIWGFFPLYFRQLGHLGPMEILSNRSAWAFIFVGILLTLWQRWGRIVSLLRNPGQVWRLVLAAMLLGANWLGFLWAVDQRQVVEASFGYFLTPLVNVLLGLVVLKERLNRLEWTAIGLAVAAIANELLILNSLPWISLFLAATFGTYGLLRKQVPVDAISGLWLETLAMLPFCLAYAFWQEQHGNTVFALHDLSTAVLLIGAGIITALPLMAFAAATQRLDLATVGMLMYINPTMQFLTAVFLFGEALSGGRIASFGLIWLGLGFFSASAWRKYRAAR